MSIQFKSPVATVSNTLPKKMDPTTRKDLKRAVSHLTEEQRMFLKEYEDIVNPGIATVIRRCFGISKDRTIKTPEGRVPFAQLEKKVIDALKAGQAAAKADQSSQDKTTKKTKSFFSKWIKRPWAEIWGFRETRGETIDRLARLKAMPNNNDVLALATQKLDASRTRDVEAAATSSSTATAGVKEFVGPEELIAADLIINQCHLHVGRAQSINQSMTQLRSALATKDLSGFTPQMNDSLRKQLKHLCDQIKVFATSEDTGRRVTEYYTAINLTITQLEMLAKLNSPSEVNDSARQALSYNVGQFFSIMNAWNKELSHMTDIFLNRLLNQAHENAAEFAKVYPEMRPAYYDAKREPESDYNPNPIVSFDDKVEMGEAYEEPKPEVHSASDDPSWAELYCAHSSCVNFDHAAVPSEVNV